MPTSLDEKRPPADERASYVKEFVDDSAEKRRPFECIWDESEANFELSIGSDRSNNTQSPLDTFRRPTREYAARLKDTESHQSIMTTVSGIAGAIFPDYTFTKFKGTGFEDIHRAKVASGLVEHTHRLPTHYSAMIHWILGAGVNGKGIVECGWEYKVEPTATRQLLENPITGERDSRVEVLDLPTWDDPRIRYTNIRHFYPDMGAVHIQDMMGCAKYLAVSANRANEWAEAGRYDKEGVREAVDRKAGSQMKEDESVYTDPTRLNHTRQHFTKYRMLEGHEYYGEVPWLPPDGIRRRVITVLEGVVVRDRPWPRRLPFFDIGMIPRLNSFYDIAPLEVMQHDQDFLDVVKSMMATAAVRMVRPSPVVDGNKVTDLSKFRTQAPDRPIPVNGSPRDVVAWPNFNPPISNILAMFSAVKSQAREVSGAPDVLQGFGLGTKRASASEFAGTLQQAQTRPELFGRVIERDKLPQLGKFIFKLHQEMLQDNEDVAVRVGESEVPVDLADVFVEGDIEYVGTLGPESDQQRLQNFRELAAAGATNPIIQQLVPWVYVMRQFFKENGMGDVAAMVGNPAMTELNQILTQLADPQSLVSNGNGEAQQAIPIGLPPEQTNGTLVQ